MRGLPDFGAPVGASCFAGFDEPGGVVALPDALSLATDPGGVPRLVLERFRNAGPGGSERPYGLVSAWFTLGWPELADGRHPVTTRAIPDAGVLTVGLDQVSGDPTVIGEPMAWDGSLAASWGARVTPEAVTWMIEALRIRLLPLHAIASLTVRGVAPRPPVQLVVHADQLQAILPPGTPGDALIALVSELTTPTGALTVVGGNAVPEQIAQAVIDRLNSDHPPPVGTELWDLSRPLITRRTVTVTQLVGDQLAAAPFDEAAMILPGVELPTLELGWHGLDVLANLPARRAGILACGVTLIAPPRPPARHQAVITGCEFTADSPRERVTLRLAPGEELDYLSEPWMVVDGPSGTSEVRGRQQQHQSQRLIVTGSDFGVRFANITAEPALLVLSTVELRPVTGTWTGEAVVLNRTSPEASVMLKAEAAPEATPQLRILLRAADADMVITLPDRPVEHCSLILAAIPGWGPHEVTCRNVGTELQAIELSDELGTISAVVALEPEELRTWTYLATDPFHPGYRYRMRPVGEPGPWLGPFGHRALVIGEQP